MDARTVPPSAGWLGKAHSPLVVWVDILPSELAAGPPAAFFLPSNRCNANFLARRRQFLLSRVERQINRDVKAAAR